MLSKEERLHHYEILKQKRSKMEVEKIPYDKWYSYVGNEAYFAYKTKVGKNILTLESFVFDIYNGILCFNIVLSIVHKRKSYKDNLYHLNKGSGYGNIEALVYAKLLIEELPSVIFKKMKREDKFILFVAGSTPRRFKIYKRSLERIGFKESYMFKEKGLIKFFERNKTNETELN